MATWEEIRGTIDKEVERLHALYKNEMRPSTEKFLVDALRTAAGEFSRLAQGIEKNASQRATGENVPR